MLKQYNLLLKKEGLDDLDLFIRDRETFDEIPLISRKLHAKIIENSCPASLIQDSLINISSFYMNEVYFHANKKLNKSQFDNFFSCITFDLNDFDFWGFYVPNILVTRKIKLFKFILNLKRINPSCNKYTDDPLLSSFTNLSLGNSFVFFKTTTVDCDAITRQYTIPNIHFERLRLS